jgi:RNA polymerase sigma factor (sigma-70 family)
MASIRQPESDPPDIAARDELQAVLLELPVRQRTAVVLRFYVDLTDRQTAELMACRPSTVRSLVARAMNRIRPMLRGAQDG